MRGKRMAQRVWPHGLKQCDLPGRSFNRFLEYGVVLMVSSPFTRMWVDANLRGGKHPLPAPLFGGMGIFPVQGVGQIHAAKASGKVALMQFSDEGEMRNKRRFDGEGKPGDAIYVQLTGVDNDVVGARINI